MTLPSWDDAPDEIVLEPEIVTPLPEGTTNSEVIDNLSSLLMKELQRVRTSGRCEVETARKNAALALELQMELSSLIMDSEIRARGAKSNLKLVEGLVAAETRASATSKMTDAAVKEKCLISPKITEAEKFAIETEVEAKKWN